MDLREWTKIFIRQRDLIKREVVEVRESPRGLTVRTKHGQEREYIVSEELSEAHTGVIVCLNTEENVKRLIERWEEYAAQEDLLLVFASPKNGEKWLLKPYHHSRVADKESLRQGLMAMHEAVPAA